MSVHFKLVGNTSDVLSPIRDLTSKRFGKVVLLCFDEVICFTTNAREHKDNLDLGKTSVYGESICIELYSEHMSWIDHGKLNILPYRNISRWVLD